MAFLLHVEGCREALKRLKLFSRRKNAFELALIGSLIPDLEMLGVVKRIHGNSYKFFQYMLKNDKKYLPIAIGMMTHELFDQVYEGQYVHAKEPIAQKLINKYDNNSSKIKYSAHILVEHSTDAHYVQENPELMELLLSIQKNVKKRHVKKIAFHLATFFKADYKEVYKSLLSFKDFSLESYRSVDGLSDMWMNFMFLQENNDLVSNHFKAGMLQNIKSNFKLGLIYTSFRLKRNKENIKQMYHNVKNHIKDHKHYCNKANNHVEANLAKILLTHSVIAKRK